MAIELLNSRQLTADVRNRVFETYGKLRTIAFDLVATTVAGDAGSTIELCKGPPGPLRVFPYLSVFECSAFGASRTLDFGHRAYEKRPNSLGIEAEDEDAFAAAIDVSSAITTPAAINAATFKFDIYSTKGVTFFATVKAGTIPIGATLSGHFVIAAE